MLWSYSLFQRRAAVMNLARLENPRREERMSATLGSSNGQTGG